MCQGLGLNPHTVAAVRNEVLTPPPYPTKLGYLGMGGGVGGSTSKNSSRDHFMSKNDYFTGGWISDTTTWGMRNKRPPNTPPPVLDLTTLFKVTLRRVNSIPFDMGEA